MINKILQFVMPDFIGIGAHKSGTSWLWQNIRTHPDVWTPKTKELHFFDRHFDDQRLPLLPQIVEAKIRYARFFLGGKVMGKTTGEFTPAYAILPKNKIKIIHSWIPQARILFVMRDPVLRAWSHAKKDFIRLSGKPLESASENDLIKFFKLPAVQNRSNYYFCLQNWTKFYTLNHFFICFTEDIGSKPISILRQVFEFLGLNPESDFNWNGVDKPVHVGPKIPMSEHVKNYLIDSLYKQNEQLESLLGRKVPWPQGVNDLTLLQ